jgi:hypothetical protein
MNSATALTASSLPLRFLLLLSVAVILYCILLYIDRLYLRQVTVEEVDPLFRQQTKKGGPLLIL